MIHFRLNPFDKIIPVGKEPHLSWFWITDGHLWLTFGNDTIYEYTSEARAFFGDTATPYNDYYLVRFLEDFTALFEKIGESLHEDFYKLTADLGTFKSNAQKWLSIYDNGEEDYCDFYFEEYERLLAWTNTRTLNSGHLTGGPELSFFRCQNKIRIVWETAHILENGSALWTAKDGSFEMEYADFVHRIKMFGDHFFNQMHGKIQAIVAHDWQNVAVDKEQLMREQQQRITEFNRDFDFLTTNKTATNWDQIALLNNRMQSEIT